MILRVIKLDKYTRKPLKNWPSVFEELDYIDFCKKYRRKTCKDPHQPLGFVLSADYIVVDVDKRNGGDKSFNRFLKDACLTTDDIAKTALVRSGRDGFHIYYRNPSRSLIYKNIRAYPGIDFLSTGCYVVLVGSHFDPSCYTEKERQEIEKIGQYEFMPPCYSLNYISDIPLPMLDLIKKEPKKTVKLEKVSDFELNEEQLRAILKKIPVADFRTYETWRDLCFACADACIEGQKVFYDWSISDKFYTDHSKIMTEVSNMWKPARFNLTSITKKTLLHYYGHYDKESCAKLKRKLQQSETDKLMTKIYTDQAKDYAFLEDIKIPSSDNLPTVVSKEQDQSPPQSQLTPAAVQDEKNKDKLVASKKELHSLDIDDYWYILNENKFYHEPSNTLMIPAAFDARFKPLLGRNNLKKILPKTYFFGAFEATRVIMKLKFLPWADRLLQDEDEKMTALNKWKPPKPININYKNVKEEDVKPWLDHYEYMIACPNDRGVFHKFLAVVMYRNRIRPRFALMLYSECEGVGKTTPLDIVLRRAVGDNYVGAVSDDDLKSNFNQPILENVVCLANDSSSTARRDVQNKLKPLITDDYVSKTEKYVKSDTGHFNCTSFILSANSKATLAIGEHDRRYAVIDCDQQPKSKTYYKEFIGGYLSDDMNLQKIIAYYYNLYENMDVKEFIVKPPNSRLKREMYEESLPVNAISTLDIIRELDIPHIDKFIVAKIFYARYLEQELCKSYQNNILFRKSLAHIGYTSNTRLGMSGSRGDKVTVFYKKGVFVDRDEVSEQITYINRRKQ